MPEPEMRPRRETVAEEDADQEANASWALMEIGELRRRITRLEGVRDALLVELLDYIHDEYDGTKSLQRRLDLANELAFTEDPSPP